MPGPRLPPRYANLPPGWLFDQEVLPEIRVTALQLKALAWEHDYRRTPPFTPEEFKALTGRSKSTLYAHIAALEARGWLLSRPGPRGSGQLIVEFRDPPEPVNDVTEFSSPPENSSRPESLVVKDSRVLKTQEQHADSGALERSSAPENPAGPGTRAIQAAYEKLLGRPMKTWAQGESTAAKEIGAAYTVAQFVEAYSHYKAQPFWADKRLSLRYLAQHMPEYFAAKAGGRLDRKEGRPHGTHTQSPHTGTAVGRGPGVPGAGAGRKIDPDLPDEPGDHAAR